MLAALALLAVAAAGEPSASAVKPAARPAVAAARAAPPSAAKPAAPAGTAPLCRSRYADALSAESASAESYERLPDHNYVYCIRDDATYEHVYYGKGGKLRRTYLHSEIHGTGFALRVDKNGDTLLVTNRHVADQPEVTDDAHAVDGVPAGSRKVREIVKLVKNQEDDYEPGQTLASRVLADPAMDLAVIKVHKKLDVMPWRIGDSSALKTGNAVLVRGYPLGAFAAANNGKVVSTGQWDSDRGWAHEDFVVDALLSQGNSGSPVFAISCRTGELELVGVYHAAYADAAALNVVIAIDQVKNELSTLRVPRRDSLRGVEVTPADRERVVNLLFAERAHELIFPYGDRTARVELTDPERLRFSILGDDFPLSGASALELWDDRGESGFGTLDAVGFPVEGRDDTVQAAALDPAVRDHFDRLYADLWRQLMAVLDYRTVALRAALDPVAHDRAATERAALRAREGDQHDLWSQVSFDLGELVGAAESGHLPVATAKQGLPLPPRR